MNWYDINKYRKEKLKDKRSIHDAPFFDFVGCIAIDWRSVKNPNAAKGECRGLRGDDSSWLCAFVAKLKIKAPFY